MLVLVTARQASKQVHLDLQTYQCVVPGRRKQTHAQAPATHNLAHVEMHGWGEGRSRLVRRTDLEELLVRHRVDAGPLLLLHPPSAARQAAT